uniref:Acetate:succinate CoA transferase n=1 Tax=Opalina sp. OP10 TaxID=2666322 RepID=A0A649UZ20_9STRA|nr:acetate:succinate CoA transferase [Opalina sp. OP10]
MTKRIIKSGKVVVVLSGRFAGRKAFVVKTFDKGSDKRKYPHALIAGVDRYPRKITKSMGKEKTVKKSKLTSFVKYINYNHVMPTRYQFDCKVNFDHVDKPESRTDVKKNLTLYLRKTYLDQGTAKVVAGLTSLAVP